MANILMSGADSGITAVPNAFIDRYLTKADGEYVKVYLLLWRFFCAREEATVSRIADLLDDTEKDVMRALRYWGKQGLLTVVSDEKQEVTELIFHPAGAPAAEVGSRPAPARAAPSSAPAPAPPASTARMAWAASSSA